MESIFSFLQAVISKPGNLLRQRLVYLKNHYDKHYAGEAHLYISHKSCITTAYPQAPAADHSRHFTQQNSNEHISDRDRCCERNTAVYSIMFLRMTKLYLQFNI